MLKDPVIIVIAFAQTMVWAGLYYVFPGLLVHWEASFGWSKAELTAAITGAILISALGSPLAGKFIDSGKGTWMMVGATVMGSLALFCLSFVNALWQFYVVWAVIGLSFAGCLYDPCFSLITRARGANAKKGIIWITLVAGFASTISFPSAHALVESYGWQVTVRVFAIVVLFIATPLMWWGVGKIEREGGERRNQEKENPKDRYRFLKGPVFWFIAPAFAFGAILHGMTLHHLLPLLYEREIPLDTAVLVASFIGPMQVAGRLAMAASEKFVSNHGVVIGCFVAMTISIVCLISSESIPMLLVLFVILFGGGYGTVSVIRPLIARDLLGGEHFGAKSGAMSMPYQAGAAVSPYLGSIIWGIGGYGLVLNVLVFLGVVGFALYWVANMMAERAGYRN